MTATADSLLLRLRELAAADTPPGRYLVAYSGGRDSSVLLHALAQGRAQHGIPVIAAHVNHRLHPAADRWQSHCEAQAAALEVPFVARVMAVDRDASGSLEAAARVARYAALSELMEDGDWLLSAHHEDDQAETLLMNLMRGSGVHGLAGIGERQAFGCGYLVRPLLGIRGDALADYAAAHRLTWVEDPSNEDLAFDRNFLRHEVMPLLESRWPAAMRGMRRSARLAGETAGLLDALAAADLAEAGRAERLSIDAIGRHPEPRQRNLLRYAVRRAGLPPAPATALRQILSELVPARDDGEPLVAWSGAEARRYRQHLYLLTTWNPSSPLPDAQLEPGSSLDLGAGQGRLSLEVAAASGGIDPGVATRGLRVRYREGGESLRSPGQDDSRKLKKLLQQHAVVPWMRARIPLLYSGDELVAVADLWIAADHHDANGYAVRWHGRPALH